MKTKWRSTVGESIRVHQSELPSGNYLEESLNEVTGQQLRLRDTVRQLRNWLYQVEQRGVPKFGETGYRLRHFRNSLSEHFDCCKRRRGQVSITSLETECRRLLKMLDDLIYRLEMPEPPFESWQELIRCMKEFTDDLECLETRLVATLQQTER